MNKKGNILDTIVIMGIIFILACGAFFATFLVKKVTGGLASSAIITNTPISNSIVTNVDTNFNWVVDFFVVMMMFGLPLFAMVLAFFNDISPLFFWATIGLTMLVIVLGGFFAMGWENYANSGEISVAKSYVPMTNFVMENYIFYSLLVVFLIGLGVYMKSKNQATMGY